MQFNFLKCWQAQEKFRFYWRPGTENLADYFTKHHTPSHHRNTRALYLTSPDDPEYTNHFQPSTQPHTFANRILNTQQFQQLAQSHFTQGTY